MLTKLALISLGGIGAALRFYVGYGIVSILPSQYLHYSFLATFCINMLACFWHRAMRGDDKRARFFAVCISCCWCAWGF